MLVNIYTSRTQKAEIEKNGSLRLTWARACHLVLLFACFSDKVALVALDVLELTM